MGSRQVLDRCIEGQQTLGILDMKFLDQLAIEDTDAFAGGPGFGPGGDDGAGLLDLCRCGRKGSIGGLDLLRMDQGFAVKAEIAALLAGGLEAGFVRHIEMDAVEGIDYRLDELIHVWTETNDQDRQIVEENARGIHSPAYRPGPYSQVHEGGVAQFVEWYSNFMEKRLSGKDKPALRSVA